MLAKSALLNRQSMRAHPEVKNGPEFGDRTWQLIVGFNGALVWPGKPPEVGAKFLSPGRWICPGKQHPAQMHGPRAGLVLLLL